tara:strand:+ start:156 stop:395 length:240 start_codon:yes stop_codon:yes gene_type:complete
MNNKEFVKARWGGMARGGPGPHSDSYERDLRRMGRIVDAMRYQHHLGADCCWEWTCDMLGKPIDWADWDAVMYQIDGRR